MVPTSYILRNILKQHCTWSDTMLSSIIDTMWNEGDMHAVVPKFLSLVNESTYALYEPINTSQVDIPSLHGRALLFLSSVTLEGIEPFHPNLNTFLEAFGYCESQKPKPKP